VAVIAGERPVNLLTDEGRVRREQGDALPEHLIDRRVGRGLRTAVLLGPHALADRLHVKARDVLDDELEERVDRLSWRNSSRWSVISAFVDCSRASTHSSISSRSLSASSRVVSCGSNSSKRMYGSGNRKTFHSVRRWFSIVCIPSQSKRMSSPCGLFDSKNSRMVSRPWRSIASWGSTRMSLDLLIARPSGMSAWPCIRTSV